MCVLQAQLDEQLSGLQTLTAARRSKLEESIKLHQKIGWLSLIGNIAPMLGLFGTVLDHEGRPLPRLTLRLLAEGARDHQAIYARSDEHGAFAFQDVHGTLVCRIWNHVFVERTVTLARPRTPEAR